VILTKFGVGEGVFAALPHAKFHHYQFSNVFLLAPKS